MKENSNAQNWKKRKLKFDEYYGKKLWELSAQIDVRIFMNKIVLLEYNTYFGSSQTNVETVIHLIQPLLSPGGATDSLASLIRAGVEIYGGVGVCRGVMSLPSVMSSASARASQDQISLKTNEQNGRKKDFPS